MLEDITKIDADVLCVYGYNPSLFQKGSPWLSFGTKRRIIFVGENEEDFPKSLENPRISFFVIQTPLQIESVSAKIGQIAVFLKLHIINGSSSRYFSLFQERLIANHELAFLRLCDAADWGCSLVQNAHRNLSKPYKSCMDLKGAFANIPAILVGAGPSLERWGPRLSDFRTKGLIFAGGNALNKIPCSPHLGACIDKAVPIKNRFHDIPFCFQARIHPENFQSFHRDALLVPESHFPFLNWISGDSDLFNGGWTVGNCMAELAVFFGCNPIVCVGMEYSYSQGKKYAFDTSQPVDDLVLSTDWQGNSVVTQRDWLMAKLWMEDLAKQNPEISFYNANGSGLPYWKARSIEEFDWDEIPDLQERIDQTIQKLPLRPPVSSQKWTEALQKILRNTDEENREEEIYSQMLFPLWEIWRPIFEREIDDFGLSFEDKMNLHKKIFFQQVIQEHLNLS